MVVGLSRMRHDLEMYPESKFLSEKCTKRDLVWYDFRSDRDKMSATWLRVFPYFGEQVPIHRSCPNSGRIWNLIDTEWRTLPTPSMTLRSLLNKHKYYLDINHPVSSCVQVNGSTVLPHFNRSTCSNRGVSTLYLLFPRQWTNSNGFWGAFLLQFICRQGRFTCDIEKNHECNPLSS